LPTLKEKSIENPQPQEWMSSSSPKTNLTSQLNHITRCLQWYQWFLLGSVSKNPVEFVNKLELSTCVVELVCVTHRSSVEKKPLKLQ
jgi:hypothetical protein